jgi:hypothetical protein
MLSKRLFKMSLLVCLALPLAASATACGGGNGAKTADDVKSGEMPVGGAWTGVYYSTTYGHLHLIQDGDSANGVWRNTAGDKWGELHGKIDGDVLRYEWTEHTVGMVGPEAKRSGKGYFRYVAPKEGEAHELRGQWGLGADELGQTWDAVKQLNMQPDPDSVRPDEIEGRVEAGGWDDEGGGGEDKGSGEGEEMGVEPAEE